MGRMNKDFGRWNEIKKATHKKDLPLGFFPKEREIWWSSVGVNIGVEMDEKRSLVLTQIRMMSTKRLRRRVGILSKRDFKKVIEVLARLLKAKPLHKEGVPRRPKPLMNLVYARPSGKSMRRKESGDNPKRI